MRYFGVLKRKLGTSRAYFVKDFEVFASSVIDIYKANFLVTLSFFYFLSVLIIHIVGINKLSAAQFIVSGFGLLCTGSVPFLIKYVRQLKVTCLVFVGGNFLATCGSVFITYSGIITFFIGIWFVIQYLVAYLVCGKQRALQYLLALFTFIILLSCTRTELFEFDPDVSWYHSGPPLFTMPIIFSISLGLLHYITSQFVNYEKRLTSELSQALNEREILVNELNKKQFELMNAKYDAESAAKIKSEFLSTMSHEIRTPLNAIIGISHILIDEEPRADQVENLNILNFSTKNLLSLVNDVLDFTKIEAGKIELEKTIFNPKVLLDSIQQAHTVQAKNKNIALEFILDAQIPTLVQGDPTRLSQVLQNLIGNAIKFTSEGKVEVAITAHFAEKEFVTLGFSIADTGIGIPADKLDTIFDSFTQANVDTTRRYGGTGLGLAITKQIIELHGSTINVESQETRGSTFTFELSFPIVLPMDADSHLPFSDQLDEIDIRGKQVLVAEDNAINVLIVKKQLTKLGVHIDVAQNGKKAVEMVKLKSYDIVLMDLHMPVMGGFEATEKIRAWDSMIPIIGLTASVESEIQHQMYQVGMNDWVFKPVEPDVLRAVLQKNLSEAESL